MSKINQIRMASSRTRIMWATSTAVHDSSTTYTTVRVQSNLPKLPADHSSNCEIYGCNNQFSHWSCTTRYIINMLMLCLQYVIRIYGVRCTPIHCTRPRVGQQ